MDLKPNIIEFQEKKGSLSKNKIDQYVNYPVNVRKFNLKYFFDVVDINEMVEKGEVVPVLN